MGYILKKESLNDFLEIIKSKFVLIAPVKKNSIHIFEEIKNIDDIDLNLINTRYPPKYFFQPRYEDIMGFEENKIEPIYNGFDSVIFGIRACDVNALAINDKLFHTDAYYMKRRKRTLLIAIQCNKAGDNCFCQYTGYDKLKEGYDLLFHNDKDQYIIEVGSEKGKVLVKLFINNLSTTNKIPKNFLKCELNVTKEQISKLKDNFHHKIFEEEAKKCLSCTACTTTCPTCLCFDIEDEINLDLKSGTRHRKHASCQLCDFSRVAGNFVFRNERDKRLKHRIFHKWQYFPDEFREFMCVGCGRCITNCPAGISMIEMVEKL